MRWLTQLRWFSVLLRCAEIACYSVLLNVAGKHKETYGTGISVFAGFQIVYCIVTILPMCGTDDFAMRAWTVTCTNARSRYIVYLEIILFRWMGGFIFSSINGAVVLLTRSNIDTSKVPGKDSDEYNALQALTFLIWFGDAICLWPIYSAAACSSDSRVDATGYDEIREA